MESIFIHLAKSSVLLLVVYLIYLLLIRVTTFHYLNRSYLLFSIGISLLIPFAHFPVEESHIVYAFTLPAINLSTKVVQAHSTYPFEYSLVISLLYTFICIVLVVKLIYFLSGLINLLYKHPKKKKGKFTLVYARASEQAFSFFRYIVMPEHLSQADEHIIIEHEMLHAHKWHSVDILLMELVKIVFWFHPVVYLLKHELVQQHEFEIDRLLTTRHIDLEQYGNLLIQQAQQLPVQLSLTNNFNHSLIKNRIKMMTKPKSNKIQLLRYVLLLPVLALIGGFVACEKKIEKTKHSVNDETYTIVEQMPEFPGGDEALLKFFGSNIVYPEAAKKANIQGIVVLGFMIEKDGSIGGLEILKDIGGGCGDEAYRVARQMPRWSPGMNDGKTVRVSFKMPIRFKL